METYWVYENWRHHRARIHTAECSHCNNGRGKRNSDLSNSGEWYGPFESKEAAADKMSGVNQDDKRSCHFCNP
jgi:hypothetical protein